MLTVRNIILKKPNSEYRKNPMKTEKQLVFLR